MHNSSAASRPQYSCDLSGDYKMFDDNDGLSVYDNYFTALFIKDCVKRGIVNSNDICKLAEDKIKNIEQEILKIENLKSEQVKYRMIIKQLCRHVTDTSAGTFNFNISFSEMSDYNKDLCIKICKFINDKQKTNPREIMDSVASVEENIIVYSMIKWLTDKNIINRTGSDRIIEKGNEWLNQHWLMEK